MNKEYVSSKTFGVDFLDEDSGERIVQITPMTEVRGTESTFFCLALTNLGSMYLLNLSNDKAERYNPVLKTVEVSDV